MSPLHDLTLGDVLREHARSWPRQTAVVDGETRLTYAELDARVNRLANAWRARGVEPGDRVLWLGQNSHRLLECLLAAAKLGAFFCPANWRQSVDEMAFVLDDLAPALVGWQSAEIGETVSSARARVPADMWIQHDGPEWTALYGDDATDPDVAIDPSEPALLMYTAAFSGRPSAAMLSHTALVGQALVIGRLADIDSTYVYLNSGPLFHVATFFSTLATFLHAGTNVFTPRVDPEELCRLIDAERCNGAFILPPTRKQMKTVNADGRYDLSSLKARAHAPWEQRPGGYGQTEVVGMLTFAAFGDGNTVGGFGRTSPLMQMRIVDADDREVPPGEIGEIVCRGPLVMRGYWNRPDETVRRFRNGWHHTNDLGRREADGSLTFIGPKARMIKSAAENIYPAEVENCIRTHPAVAACAVIGVPDPTWTQQVVAIVVVRDGETATAHDIIEHCRSRIASYKKPRRVEFVDTLPADPDAAFGGGGYPGTA
jgi:acyl-CoA synthetase (AMP-forming)/AMP-acid ligase II